MSEHRSEVERLDDAIPAPERTFHLVELIGQGAFGDVYLAEQHSAAGFRRKVALKLLNDDMVQMRSAGRRMRDEARVLGLLTHRRIVAVHDLVRVGDRWAVLMDYVPGADLARTLEALSVVGSMFPACAALEVGAAIFEALDFAATTDDGNGRPLGVIHRDVKPSNVRLTPDGDVKVVDFGIARFAHEARESETGVSVCAGTDRYMAPERLLREGDSAAGDVYAATATVVELILGRPLGRSPLLPEAHATFVDEALAQVRPRLDADPRVVERVLGVLERGLRADPTRRPTSREMGSEFERLARVVQGPSLVEFARWFVPRVDGVLGPVAQPDSVTLVEGTGPTASMDRASTVDDVVKTEAEAEFFDESPSFEDPITVDLYPRRRSPLVPLAAIFVFGSFSIAMMVIVGSAALEADPIDLVTQWIDGGPPPVALPDAPSLASVVAPVVEEPEGLEPIPGVGEPEAAPEIAPAAAPPVPETVSFAAAPEREAPPVEVSSGLRVSEATVTAPDATRLSVRCGDVRASGTTEARVVSFPAGLCAIELESFDDVYRVGMTIDEPTTLQCGVEAGVLRCS